MTCIFQKIGFQRISVIFRLVVPDVLKIVFSTMDLLYNRIILYNRTIFYNRIILYNRIIHYNGRINSLVLFTYTGVAFGTFDITCFRLTLKTLDIAWFLW